ncbi:N-acetylmuramoyl-L-alanine amidase family protein [Laceyella putida]|uniref:N-acetylmuramoyl-L-alanine amidase n=1 Tax=Laceyella putida TaxID=110101 RepID=A0ABW2RLA8_9BACL
MLVCLDPGHGGEDYGAVGPMLTEKEVCLDIARRIHRELLHYDGIRVTMTRSLDIRLSAEERIRWANQCDADLFLSIHTHASLDPNVSGFASYVSVIAGHEARRIQCWLHNQIAFFMRKYGVADLGKKNDTEWIDGQLLELRQVKMPAIAVKSLSITHAEDNHLLSDYQFREEYAQCIAAGIARIYQCRRKEEASV